ncbi:MAG: LysM peptidoglycan-binding domain-containing protein [Leptolyngbya sp. LCM1.Bin17]|nr:MAG: LysM peptidoglycan-binding domain-containing protein [Leptolyngbya sp. LCM1.Bin17]
MVDSHSSSLNEVQLGASGGSRRVQTSAAMLGIALSFGASAPLLYEPEMALAADGSAIAVLPAARSSVEASGARGASSQRSVLASYYTVEDGDSLWQIAKRHQADIDSIKVANGISPEEVLRAGQVIRVPAVGMADTGIANQDQRLALRSDGLGGVGGDLSAAATLSLSASALSVDDLEKVSADELEPEDMAGLALDEYDDDVAIDVADEDVPSLLASANLDESSSPDASVIADDQPATSDWSVADVAGVDQVASAQVSATEDVSIEEAMTIMAADEASAATPTPGHPSTLPLHEQSPRPRLAVRSAPAEATANLSVDPDSTPEAVDSESVDNSAAAEDNSAAADINEARVAKEEFVAVLTPGEADSPQLLSTSAAPASAATSSYDVKPGDTLWTIASNHGVTLQELLSHNHGIAQPEAIVVGDSISLPTATAPANEVSEDSADRVSAYLPSVSTPRTRDQAIQDHLARIRESANSLVDREELNARIRQAREELERTRLAASERSQVSLEYYSDGQAVALASPEHDTMSPAATATASTPATLASSQSSQWRVTDASQADDAEAAVAAVISPGVTQPTDIRDIDSLTDEVPKRPDSRQLLAAAPLEPDAYRATPSLPTGQTVSPSMPLLPSSGEFLPEAPERFNGYIWPTHGTFTSGYGWRWGRMHRGIDVAGPVGTPIVAAASGVVERSGWNSGGYGNMVDIRHPDGSMTRYAHNNRNLVRAGQEVRQGQQIAEMGSTGFSTGPHLHFEVHLPNQGTVNPMAFLPSR